MYIIVGYLFFAKETARVIIVFTKYKAIVNVRYSSVQSELQRK
jgi:hypothetical protein